MKSHPLMLIWNQIGVFSISATWIFHPSIRSGSVLLLDDSNGLVISINEYVTVDSSLAGHVIIIFCSLISAHVLR